MDVLTFDDPGPATDPASFAVRVRPVLAAHPVLTNVLATWLQDVLDGAPTEPTRWFLIEDDGSAIAAAMHTAGFNLMVSALPEAFRVAAAEGLADALAPRADCLTGVTGGIADSEAIAEAWRVRQGIPWSVALKDWLYAIDVAPKGPEVPGVGRFSVSEDIPVVLPQLAAFYREVYPGRSIASSEGEAARRLERRPLVVWDCDGVIVSLAGLNGPVAGIGRVGPVYTPPEHRRRGFGAAVTAHVAQLAFGQGAHTCMLYADQDNLTSNRVYSGLGFRRVGDNQMVAFGPA